MSARYGMGRVSSDRHIGCMPAAPTDATVAPDRQAPGRRSGLGTVEDVRVCDLAVAISEAQRRKIDEMEWLIEDIRENGAASTREEAEQRAVPSFPADAVTECDPD